VIAYMNRESNNHYAELLFRDAARGRRGEQVGSAAAGNATLQQILRDRVGVAPGAVHAADGSGLSTLDQVTARSMVQLLGYAHRAPWGSVFHASLPVAGGSGTLKGHMRYTPAQGNLHAKTGTTNRVVSLGGYVHRGRRRGARLQLHLQRHRPVERPLDDRRDGRDDGGVRAGVEWGSAGASH
jgi:D-alanyl-D-alanine carboxypeptidase/D-alanyl-D-alanine-endopeptidase (penicillin-binding protein 4)